MFQKTVFEKPITAQELSKRHAQLKRCPSWELRNIVYALDLHPWNNTRADWVTLAAAKAELGARSKLKKEANK